MRYTRVLRHPRVHRSSFRDRAAARRRSDPHGRPHPRQRVYPANSVALLHGGRLFRSGEPERLEDPLDRSRIWPHVLDHAVEGPLLGPILQRCFRQPRQRIPAERHGVLHVRRAARHVNHVFRPEHDGRDRQEPRLHRVIRYFSMSLIRQTLRNYCFIRKFDSASLRAKTRA